MGVEQKHTIWGLLPWVCAWPFMYLAVWAWSSHLTSVFSYGKWAMMIIPPSRLHMCLQRASGPERAFWVPECGTNMNYSATWVKAIFCLEVMATIPKAKILIQAKWHIFLNPDPELWLSRCFCFLGSHNSGWLLAQITHFLSLTSQSFLFTYFSPEITLQGKS